MMRTKGFLSHSGSLVFAPLRNFEEIPHEDSFFVYACDADVYQVVFSTTRTVLPSKNGTPGCSTQLQNVIT